MNTFEGTDDLSNYFIIQTSLKYYKKIGGRSFLIKNSDNLLEPLRQKLCKELGCKMYPVPANMQAPFMKIVRLPDSIRYEKSWKGADQLWSDLNSRYKLSVYISFANNSLWERINYYLK